jgi:hypothetical protein
VSSHRLQQPCDAVLLAERRARCRPQGAGVPTSRPEKIVLLDSCRMPRPTPERRASAATYICLLRSENPLASLLESRRTAYTAKLETCYLACSASFVSRDTHPGRHVHYLFGNRPNADITRPGTDHRLPHLGQRDHQSMSIRHARHLSSLETRVHAIFPDLYLRLRFGCQLSWSSIAHSRTNRLRAARLRSQAVGRPGRTLWAASA